MPKPWAKYEIGFIRHAKFLCLSGNAIALWWEGKNYCDEHLTDGFFPREALRTFRFRAPRSVELLMQSCGVKPNGEAYAPLWDAIDIGGVPYIRMHDYLLHNDCREVVQKRMQAADEKTQANRTRLSAWRDAKKAKRETRDETPLVTRDETPLVTPDVTLLVTPDETRLKRSIQNQNQNHNQKEEQKKSGGGGKERPQFQNQRFAVHRWQVDELISMLGAQVDTFDLDEWLLTGAAARAAEEPGVIPDWWKWLKAETLREAKRRGLPMANGSMRVGASPPREWDCPHDPPCSHPTPCRTLLDIAAVKAGRAVGA